jgi:hypothetical protein
MSREIFTPLLAIIYILSVAQIIALAVVAIGYDDYRTAVSAGIILCVYTALIWREWRRLK